MYYNPTTHQLTTRPRISGVTNPTEATILANGWVKYTDNPPTIQEGERAVKTTITAEGVQLYDIEPIPTPTHSRLTKLELKRALHRIDRADVWATLEGLMQADPSQLNQLQINMRDWMLFGTHLDKDDADMDALEAAFNLNRTDVFEIVEQ